MRRGENGHFDRCFACHRWIESGPALARRGAVAHYSHGACADGHDEVDALAFEAGDDLGGDRRVLPAN